jgi:threonyl-tRNA synthetase
VIPVAEKFREYGEQVAKTLRAERVRVQLDDRNQKMGYKIREAQLQKVPLMLIVGGREQEAGTVSVRHRKAGDLGARKPDELARVIARLVSERALDEDAIVDAGGDS